MTSSQELLTAANNLPYKLDRYGIATRNDKRPEAMEGLIRARINHHQTDHLSQEIWLAWKNAALRHVERGDIARSISMLLSLGELALISVNALPSYGPRDFVVNDYLKTIAQLDLQANDLRQLQGLMRELEEVKDESLAT